MVEKGGEEEWGVAEKAAMQELIIKQESYIESSNIVLQQHRTEAADMREHAQSLERRIEELQSSLVQAQSDKRTFETTASLKTKQVEVISNELRDVVQDREQVLDEMRKLEAKLSAIKAENITHLLQLKEKSERMVAAENDLENHKKQAKLVQARHMDDMKQYQVREERTAIQMDKLIRDRDGLRRELDAFKAKFTGVGGENLPTCVVLEREACLHATRLQDQLHEAELQRSQAMRKLDAQETLHKRTLREREVSFDELRVQLQEKERRVMQHENQLHDQSEKIKSLNRDLDKSRTERNSERSTAESKIRTIHAEWTEEKRKLIFTQETLRAQLGEMQEKIKRVESENRQAQEHRIEQDTHTKEQHNHQLALKAKEIADLKTSLEEAQQKVRTLNKQVAEARTENRHIEQLKESLTVRLTHMDTANKQFKQQTQQQAEEKANLLSRESAFQSRIKELTLELDRYKMNSQGSMRSSFP